MLGNVVYIVSLKAKHQNMENVEHEIDINLLDFELLILHLSGLSCCSSGYVIRN